MSSPQTEKTSVPHGSPAANLLELVAELDRLRGRCRELENILRSHRCDSELGRLRSALIDLTGLPAGTDSAELLNALRELPLRQASSVIAGFAGSFEQELARYRAQRAWKAMLFIRMAYTLLLKRGWRGRVLLLRWLLGSRNILGARLTDYEIPFVKVEPYLPPEIHKYYEAARHDPDARVDQLSQFTPTSAIPSPLAAKFDLIVLPVFEFDFRKQRPQHLAEEFARRGHRIFWISPGRPSAVAGEIEFVRLGERLWEVRFPIVCPDIYGGDISGHLEVYEEGFVHLIRRADITSTCLLVQFPFWGPLAIRLRSKFSWPLIYDRMDDWQHMPGVGRAVRQAELRLIEEADLCIASGPRLLEVLSSSNKPAVLIRNAVDFDFFSNGRPANLLRNIPRPIVGYFGALGEWFDYDLLREVALARPRYSFVLIGGKGLEERVNYEETQGLDQCPNVHFLGHKPYGLLPAYLAEFDACILPFARNEVTAATDPVKLYEYLSQGKPVVTTPIGDLAASKLPLYVAENAQEFARALDEALQPEDEEVKRQRVEFARRNTWSQRAERLLQSAEECFPLVSVIIVTHNSGRFIELCLRSLLLNTDYPRYEVLVVDNASSDQTCSIAEVVASGQPRVRIFRQQTNLGFAAACNLGVRSASGEFLVLLNADTALSPGWLGRLVRHALKDHWVGLVVPVTNWAGNEARIETYYNNMVEMERFARDRARDWLGVDTELKVAPLFCALIPSRVWKQVGELDERFQVGMFEDDDYSLRVKRAGYRVICAEDCFVHHFGGGSFQQKSPEEYRQIFERNQRLFEEKWNIKWTPHTYRPGLSSEPRRFDPEEFIRGWPGLLRSV